MIELDPNKGLLRNVPQVASPNCNERPVGMRIDLLVIHNISLPAGEFGGPHIDALFRNALEPSVHPDFPEIAALQVSSHCLIRRTGEIIQYVPFHQRAWHAGASEFLGREDCNDFSIGIELEGTDSTPYTAIQYEILAELSALLQKQYPAITAERIVGHNTIAPERKTDPGPAFDWNLFRALCGEYTAYSIG